MWRVLIVNTINSSKFYYLRLMGKRVSFLQELDSHNIGHLDTGGLVPWHINKLILCVVGAKVISLSFFFSAELDEHKTRTVPFVMSLVPKQ